MIGRRVAFVRTPESAPHHVFGPDTGTVTALTMLESGPAFTHAYVQWSNGLHSRVPLWTLRELPPWTMRGT